MMPKQLPTIPATPELYQLRKMKPDEITNSESRIYCDGHFFPVSISGVAASDYGQPIYQLTEVDKDTGKAA